MTTHIATLAAYPIKEELGGGFRGVMLIKTTRERRISGVLPNLMQATNWAKNEAYKAYNETGYTLAPLRRKGEYQANVWIA